MKLFRILLLIILISPIKAIAFDYQSYAKQYLDNVNETKVRDGVCLDLVLDMFSEINDKMLVDTTLMVWGEPITNIDSVEIGDIIVYSNHIVIVYTNHNNEILIAEQNRNGDSSGVEIHLITDEYRKMKCRIYRPITLSEISIYNSGKKYDKKFCLKLFTIHVDDTEKMSRSSFNLDYDPTLRPYILDPNFNYTDLELNYAEYFNGKVYCIGENGCYIKTPIGRLVLGQTHYDYWKPIKMEKN